MSRWRTWVVGLLLVGATLGLYWPVRHFQFVDYDDNVLVTDNEVVKSGLNWASVRWALTTPVVANYHPVTTLSHMLDCQLFGVNAGPQHLVNAILHAINALLLFLVLRRMTGAFWRSAVVAGIFALHPLRVESVAWIAERKDVLSGLFFMLTLYAWARYAGSEKEESEPLIDTNQRLLSETEHRTSNVERPTSNPRRSAKGEGRSAKDDFQPLIDANQRSLEETKHRTSPARRSLGVGRNRRFIWYSLALAFFALGLLSKPMLVTLPFVLLLLDYWPLERWECEVRRLGRQTSNVEHRTSNIEEPRAAGETTSSRRLPEDRTSNFGLHTSRASSRRLLQLVVEKVPFLGLAALFSFLTYQFQKTGTAVVSMERVGLGDRLGNAVVSYLRYLGKFFWPTDLAAIYPHPSNPFALADRWSAWQIWAGATALLGITGLFLRRVKGDFQPLINANLRSLKGLEHRTSNQEKALQEGTAAGGRSLGVGSSNESDSPHPNPSPVGRGEKARREKDEHRTSNVEHRTSNQSPESEDHRACKASTAKETSYFELQTPHSELRPSLVGWLWFLGMMVPVIGLVQVGGQAMADRYTYLPMIGVTIAVVWWLADRLGTGWEVAQVYNRPYRRLAVGMASDAQAAPKTSTASHAQAAPAGYKPAIRQIEKLPYVKVAIALAVLVACAAFTHRQLSYWHDTISLFQHTIDVTADNPDAHFGLGIGLQKAGQLKRAMTEYRVALAINPSLAEAHYNLGQMLREENRLPEAAGEYEAVLRTYPDHSLAHYNLGGVYWLLGRREEALAQMEAAIRSDPSSAEARNNLAWWLAAGPDAKLRDGARAVELAERACAMTGYKRPVMIGTLAAAYAEAGRFNDAVVAAERASAAAEEAGDKALAEKNRELEDVYKQGKAFHEERSAK